MTAHAVGVPRAPRRTSGERASSGSHKPPACKCLERFVSVLGGPGTGKTHALVTRAAWLMQDRFIRPDELLLLVPSKGHVAWLRRRLVQHLSEAGLPGVAIREAATRVATVRDLALRVVAPRPASEAEQAARLWLEADAEVHMRPLVEAVGPTLSGQLVSAAAKRVAAQPGIELEQLYGTAAMMRLGMAVVEEARHDAAAALYRRLRCLRDAAGELGSLATRLCGPSDVIRLAAPLQPALATSRLPDSEELLALANLVAVNRGDAASLEAAAASLRATVYLAARAIVRDQFSKGVTGCPVEEARRRLEEGLGDPGVMHLLVDDAHALGRPEAELIRVVARSSSLFVCGDPLGVAGAGGDSRVLNLVAPGARRTLLEVESRRHAPDLVSALNAFGTALWPAGSDSAFTPLGFPSSGRSVSGCAVEVRFVLRRSVLGPDGRERPEPFEQARCREAVSVAESAAELVRSLPAVDVAALLPTAEGAAVIRSAMAARQMPADRVEVCTIDEAQGREWDAVIVAQLDDHFSHTEMDVIDATTGLPLIGSVKTNGHRIRPLSTQLLRQRAQRAREDEARRRFFQAAARARSRLVLSGLSREVASGGRGFAAPIEWLRRGLDVPRLSLASGSHWLRGVPFRVTVIGNE